MTGAAHIRNLLRIYDWGTQADRAEALASYARYNAMIAEIAGQTSTPLRVAVGVFAALSPNNSYILNLKNCRTLLRAAKEGESIDSFSVNTYGANKRKAWEMATGGVDPLEAFKGRKTRAFFLNIMDPRDPEPVTVDGHIYWVWMGRKGVVKTRGPERADTAPPHLGARLYEEIADGVRLAGEMRGVIGCECQAVLWQNWRRMHSVQGSAQMELLARDTFAVGNPHHELARSGCGQ